MGRCGRPFVTVALAVCLALTALAPARADKRVALVIGNGAYKHAAQLPNPANDARDVATALARVGFDTILGLDLDRAGMDDYAVRFARAARDADVALFYYSGHAMQFAGLNYLIPIDAILTDEADLRRLARVDDFVADLQQARNLKILVLDSCRNNPLAEELKRSIGLTRAVSVSRGLAKIDPPQGMIVAYSTQSGRTAEDGFGRNSPYTAAFLKYIERPEEIGTVFRRISADVYETTQRTQLPELSLSLIGEFYLRGLPQAAAAAPVSPVPATDSAPAQAWAATRDTSSIAVLEAFLQQYGDSIFAPFARARRDELRNLQVAVAKPAAPAAPDSAPKSVSPPRLARDEVVKLFVPLATVLEKARKEYVEPPDERKLLGRSIEGMRTAFPADLQLASATPVAPAGASGIDLATFYDGARDILNRLPNNNDDTRAVQVAITGMMAALDPHSGYLDAQSFRDMQVQTKGEFGGLGIEVTMQDGLVRVVTPLDDTPAAKAGILAGDLITKLDDTPVQGLTLNDAVGKMRGPVGSKLKLTVTRQSRDQPLEISVTRDVIRVRSVRARIEGGDVGYIRITQFNEQTPDGVKKAISDLAAEAGNAAKLKGYIIDLRNNPGGLLDKGIAVADEFLNKGDIVATRGRTADSAQRFSAKPGDSIAGKPLVVLINGGTAAMSEILAGALQDNKRATIVGTRSFGKGTVQTIHPLGGDLGALRLTTALYYTPSGRAIQARGIEPDVTVLQDVPDELKDKQGGGEAALPGHLRGTGAEQAGSSQSYVPPAPKDDKALQRAIELLHAAKK